MTNHRLTALGGLALVMAVGTRLLVVSNYDSGTAMVILRLGGITDTLTGTMLPLLPILLPTLTVLLFMNRSWLAGSVGAVCTVLVAATSHSWSEAPGIFNSFTHGVMKFWGLLHSNSAEAWELLWARSPVVVVVMIVAFAWAVMGEKVGEGEKRDGWIRRLVRGAMAAVLSGAALILGSAIYPIPPRDSGVIGVAIHRMWMTPEIMTLKSGGTQVGYRLGPKDGWEVVLSEPDRQIRYLKADDISGRQVCSIERGVADRTPVWVPPGVVLTHYRACQ